jgi:TatA/E family protein of Tat protein translocase
MGPIGIPEMVGIFIIALLLFGPKKLPELGRTLGKALSEFRRAKNELKSTFESHLHELEREARLDTQTPKLEAASPAYSPSSYTYPYDDGSPYGSTSSPHEEPLLPPPVEEVSAVPPVLQPAAGTVARSNGTAPVMSEVPHAADETTEAAGNHHA